MSSPPSAADEIRNNLRRQLRLRRGAIPQQVAQAAANASADLCVADAGYRHAEHIAAYVAVNDELDPAPLLAFAHKAGKRVYLPRLTGIQSMQFVAWQPGDRLQPNRFGIPEPVADACRTIMAMDLDLVLVPLLGFDVHGNRLGYGAGFYDRTFAFKREGRLRPLLYGYAYALQRCTDLPTHEWDVSLDAAVTEHGIHRFHSWTRKDA